MVLKRFFILFLTLALTSCLDSAQNECANVICPGLGVLAFDVRQGTDNVFDIGTYSLFDVDVDDTNAQLDLDSSISSSDVPILLLLDTDWTAGTFDYLIELGDDSFTIDVTFELSEENQCCGQVPLLTAIEINDVNIDLPVTSGIFMVNL